MRAYTTLSSQDLCFYAEKYACHAKKNVTKLGQSLVSRQINKVFCIRIVSRGLNAVLT